MGERLRICDLRQKEVINVATCKRLGFVCDVEFDCRDGHIVALIVPGCGRIWGLFGREGEYVIPFPKICQIGEEIILVDLSEEDGKGKA